MTVCFRRSRFTMTSARLRALAGRVASTSCAEGSRARTSPAPASEPASKASAAGSGGRCTESFAKWNPSSSSWRTSQLCLFGDSMPFSDRWPTSGSMRSGACSRRRSAGRPTFASACGYSLPTPTVTDSKSKGYTYDQGDKTRPRLSLTGLARLWPTPQAHDAKLGYAKRVGRFGTKHGCMNLNDWVMLPTPAARGWKDGAHPAELDRNTPGLAAHAGGALNPTWVEWLMGWPLGWTDCEPLGMDKFQSWLRLHSGC